MDAVRGIDFAPRALRAAGRDLEHATAAVTAEKGRTPTTAEVAERLGVTSAEVLRLQGRIHGSLVLSLDAPSGEGDEGSVGTLAGCLVDSVQVDPSATLEERERLAYLRDAVELLPDRLREVISGYFLDGETSGEIAARLGVTESRVSQMRSEALRLMKTGLEAQFSDRKPEVPYAPAGTVAVTSREAGRQAAYAAELAARSSFAARLRVPKPRTEAPVQVRATA